MEAKFERRGKVVVISLSGRIDYESADKFRKTCLEMLTKEKVVMDLSQLSFVGSSGITPFVETMSTLSNQTEGGIKFCQVGPEFRKIFESSPLKLVEIYESREAATLSYESYPLGGGDYNFIEGESAIQNSIEGEEALLQPPLNSKIEIKE